MPSVARLMALAIRFDALVREGTVSTQADLAAQQAKAQADMQLQREEMIARMALERWKAEQEFELRKVEMAGEFALKREQIAQAGRQQGETNIARPQ